MPYLLCAQLAPVRIPSRIGASVFTLKAPADLTLLSLLEIQREVRLLQDSEDVVEQRELFFGIVRRVVIEAMPEELPLDDCLPALTAFFAQLTADKEVEPGDDREVDYGILAGRLAVAYGGGMWHWLSEVPLPVFNAAVGLLGPLEAERHLTQMTTVALGFGTVKKPQADSIRQEWQRLAQRMHPVEDAAPLTKAETIARFQLIGVP